MKEGIEHNTGVTNEISSEKEKLELVDEPLTVLSIQDQGIKPTEANLLSSTDFDAKVNQELTAQATSFVRNFSALKNFIKSYTPKEFYSDADAENWEIESLAAAYDFAGLEQLVSECIDAGSDRDLDNAVRALCAMGRELHKGGNLKEATKSFDHALKVANELDGEYGRYAFVPIILAKVACGLGEEASSLLDKVKDWSERASMSLEIARSEWGKSNPLLSEKLLESAEAFVLNENHISKQYEDQQASLVFAYLEHKQPDKAQAVIQGLLDSQSDYTPTPSRMFGDDKLRKVAYLSSKVHKYYLENGQEENALKIQKEIEKFAIALLEGEVITGRINYSNAIAEIAHNFHRIGMSEKVNELLKSFPILQKQVDYIALERKCYLARLGVADEEIKFRSGDDQQLESIVIGLIDGGHHNRIDKFINLMSPAENWSSDFSKRIANVYMTMDKAPDAIDMLAPLKQNLGYHHSYLLEMLHSLYERQRAVDLDSFALNFEILDRKSIKEEFKRLLVTEQLETFDQCMQLLNVPPEVSEEIVNEAVIDEGVRVLQGASKNSLLKLVNHFLISPEIINDALCLPSDCLKESPEVKAQDIFIANAQNSKDPANYVSFVMKDLGYKFDRAQIIKSLSDSCTECFEADPKYFAFGSFMKDGIATQRRASGPVRFTQWHLVEDLIIKNGEKWDESQCQKAWARLKMSPQWKASPVAVAGFEIGASYFGYKAMLKYSSAADVSLHDIFYAMPAIVRMSKSYVEYRGFTPGESAFNIKQAFSRMLEQVAADSSDYEEGNSYQHLNAYALSGSGIYPYDLLQMVLADSDRRSDGQLMNLVQFFQVPENVLGSWAAFKKYQDFCYIYENETELLNELYLMEQEVSQLEGSEADGHRIAKSKADYFRAILFHPGGRINAQALVELFNNPHEFLERNDEDSPPAAHDKKKPSNYIDIPHLGLSAEDLVKALVSGAMDNLQVLPSASYLYSLSQPGYVSSRELEESDIRKIIIIALGSTEGNVRSLLSQSGKKVLFKQLNDVIRSEDSRKDKNLNAFLAGEFELSSASALNFRTMVTGALIREGKLVDNQKEYLVSIHKKSSPIGVIAGNDTVCCMPFGSGKSNIYMFNPNCVQLTVQEVRDVDGQYVAGRTVAQSVVTLNIDAKHKVPKLQEQLEEHGHLYKIIDEDLLVEQERYLACDSIEYHENSFKSEADANMLQQVYEDFFFRYLNRLPDVLEDGHYLNRERVLVSNTHGGPFIKSLAKVSNTYVPLAPMAYSDMFSDRARLLKPRNHVGIRVAEVEAPDTGSNVIKKEIVGRASNLTYRDSLQVAYLEGKIYSDLETVIANLENIENGLIAKDIANSYRKAPELSLKYIDRNGRMRAYLYAYEGRVDHENSDYLDLPEDSKLVYISDFASLRPNSLEAGKLLLEFIDRYKKAYYNNILEEGFPPIFFSARATTSHKLIEKQVDNISKRLGRDVEMIELESDSSSGENFNDVLLLIH